MDFLANSLTRSCCCKTPISRCKLSQHHFRPLLTISKTLFVEQVSKRSGRYDEMPKSSTMENRQNLLDQQFYATVQRQKTPALTPFSSGYEVDTIEQLKRAVRSQVTAKIFTHAFTKLIPSSNHSNQNDYWRMKGNEK